MENLFKVGDACWFGISLGSAGGHIVANGIIDEINYLRKDYEGKDVFEYLVSYEGKSYLRTNIYSTKNELIKALGGKCSSGQMLKVGDGCWFIKYDFIWRSSVISIPDSEHCECGREWDKLYERYNDSEIIPISEVYTSWLQALEKFYEQSFQK